MAEEKRISSLQLDDIISKESQATIAANVEGALKPFTNTFDRLRGKIDAIIAEQDRITKAYPEQAEAISQMAIQQIYATLEEAGVSPDSYRSALQTEKQYALPFGDDPITYTKGIARALGQGMFLGTGDELEAFVTHMIKNKLLGHGGDQQATYQDVLTEIQAGLSAFEKANPGISLTSEILGGFYMPGYTTAIRAARGAVGGIKALSAGGREAGAQALVAAPAGTLYSYAKDRDVSVADPLLSGGFAGTFSRAGTKIGETRRAADERIAITLPENIPWQDKLASKLPNIPAPPQGPPGKIPGELGEPGSRSFHEAAMREIIQAADDEGVTFEQLLTRLDDYVKANLGEHVRMIDIVKEEGHLARTIRGLRTDNPKASAAKESFVERAIDAKKRTIPRIFQVFDPKGAMKSVGNNIERWLRRSQEIRQRKAQPLYDQFDRLTLYDPTQEVVEGKELASMLGEQLFERITTAMKFDDKIKKAWQSATGKLAWNDPQFVGTVQDQILNGKRFNAFKKKLDGQIGEMLKAGNLEEAADLITVKNDMIKTVDKIVEQQTGAKQGRGVYQRARDIYSGSLAADNAFELGTGAVKSHKGNNYSADKFEVLFDDLSQSEKAFARLGLGQAFREALEGDMAEITPNVRKLILGGAEPNILERKFNYAFKGDTVVPKGLTKSGKERKDELIDVLNKEGRFLKSFRFLFGGSDTAMKMSDASSVNTKLSDVVETVSELGPEAIITKGVPAAGLFQKATGYIGSKFSEPKRRQLVREKYAGELGEILFKKGGDRQASGLRTTLQDLINYRNQLDLEQGLLGISPYKQIPRLGRYSLLQPTTPPDVAFPLDTYENK